MNNLILAKVKALVFTLTISGASFGQLNNCINIKEHPLLVEILDSVKANPNYKSILAYAIIKGNQLGLARSTVLNLAYGWATCKKITDPSLRQGEEFRFLDAILSREECEKLFILCEKHQSKK